MGTLVLVKDIAINPGPFTGSLGSGCSDSLGSSGSLGFSGSLGSSGSDKTEAFEAFVNDIAINPGPFAGSISGSFWAELGSLVPDVDSGCSLERSSSGMCAIFAGFLGGIGLVFLSADSPIRCPVFICCSRSRKDLYLVVGLVSNDVLSNVFLVISAPFGCLYFKS